MKYAIFERSYGQLPGRYDTEEEAQQALNNDPYYEPGDMTIWIGEAEDD